MNEFKKSQFLEIVTGILLIMPFHLIVTKLLKIGFIEYEAYNILFFLSLYLTAIVGIVLLFVLYKEKINNPLSIFSLIFLALSFFHCINSFFVKNGLDGIGHTIFFIITTIIYRILIAVLYGKRFGWKKAIPLIICYEVMLFSYILLK